MKFLSLSRHWPAMWAALAWAALAIAPAWAQRAVPPGPPVAASASSAAVTLPAHYAPPSAAVAPATLRVWQRDVVTFRAVLAGMDPAQRVERARERLRRLGPADVDRPLLTVPVVIDGRPAVQITLQGDVLFTLTQGDVDAASGQSLSDLLTETLARLGELRRTWHEAHDAGLWLRGGFWSLLATALLAGVLWGGFHLQRRLRLALGLRSVARSAGVQPSIARAVIERIGGVLMGLAYWSTCGIAAYVWLAFVLGSFPVTQPLAQALGQWLLLRGQGWLSAALLSIPDLLTVIVVLVLTRAAVDAAGYVFRRVQEGHWRIPLLHADTVSATRRIATVLIWGLGISIAYPYLPGADSEAFKGLSVLFGLMLTLGSAGLVTQAMSGLVVIYSRALRRGDFVEAGAVSGTVLELGPLACKLRTPHGQELTVPHAVLIGQPVLNHTRMAEGAAHLLTTTLTIGYDAPWQQVHGLMEQAAREVPGLLSIPAPRVYQRALSDFYVEYELQCYTLEPQERLRLLSHLHERLQDVFNAAGVQIMSPHFVTQPAQAILARRVDAAAPHPAHSAGTWIP